MVDNCAALDNEILQRRVFSRRIKTLSRALFEKGHKNGVALPESPPIHLNDKKINT